MVDNITVQDGMEKIVFVSNNITSNSIDLSALDNGMYFLVLRIDNREILKRIEILK